MLHWSGPWQVDPEDAGGSGEESQGCPNPGQECSLVGQRIPRIDVVGLHAASVAGASPVRPRACIHIGESETFTDTCEPVNGAFILSGHSWRVTPGRLTQCGLGLLAFAAFAASAGVGDVAAAPAGAGVGLALCGLHEWLIVNGSGQWAKRHH